MKRKKMLARRARMRAADPVVATGWMARSVDWLMANEIVAILLMSVVLGLLLLLKYATDAVGTPALWPGILAIAWIGGMFLAVFMMTEDHPTRGPYSVALQALAGAAAGVAIVLIHGAAWEPVCIAAIVGAVVGALATFWARYI
jgi:hypothetical protein